MDGVDQVEHMQELVQESAAVIVGLSSNYRSSRACRMEYDHAYYDGKPIILVKFEPDYEPDGWLAILVGSQIWHDCSDASDWDTDAILREMAEKCNQNMTLLTAEEESKCEEMLARLASEDEAQQLQASKEIHDAVAWEAVRSLR